MPESSALNPIHTVFFSYVYIQYSTHMLKHGMIHCPGRIEQDSERFHHATKNGIQFKTYKLFISAISHLIFSGFN
jgi:hypothetical protein